ECADAGAVDERNAAQIDDEMSISAAKELLQVALEGLRRTARDERLHRRHDKAIADGPSKHGLVAGSGLYTKAEAVDNRGSRRTTDPGCEASFSCRRSPRRVQGRIA